MRISHSLEFPVLGPEAAKRARTAMDVYINRLLKYVGSYAAELGGLDVITFTAGIGENDDDVRRELAEALAPSASRSTSRPTRAASRSRASCPLPTRPSPSSSTRPTRS